MASPQEYDGMTSTLKQVSVVDTSDRTTAAVIPVSEANVDGTWFDMQDYEAVLVYCILSTRADNIESFSIQADSSSAGSGGNVSIVEHSDPTACNLGGDSVVLQCSKQQIAQEGEDGSDTTLRYISAKVKTGNSSDRVTIIITGKPRHLTADLTADYSA